MSNPTTYYGWQMPEPTNLVTDLPADFEVFGQAVDTDFQDLLGGTTGQLLSKTSATDLDFTWIDANAGDITGVTAGTGISGGGTSGTVTVTNSMATAIDAKGDLIVGTGADAFSRLAVGATNGHVLTVDSAEATGLKYSSVAGGLTKITSGSFSNVATVTVDDVFSATYLNYLLVLNIYASERTDDLYIKLRFGSSTRTTNYYSSAFRRDPANTQTAYGAAATGQFILSDRIGNSAEPSAFNLYFSKVGNTSENPNVWGMGNIDGNNGVGFFSGWNESLSTYTGVVLSSSSSNISGNYAFYGLAN